MCSCKVLRMVLTVSSLSSIVLSSSTDSVASSTISGDQPYDYSINQSTTEGFGPSNEFSYQESLSEVPDSFMNVQGFPYPGFEYLNYGQRSQFHHPSTNNEIPLRNSELSYFLPEFIRFMEAMVIIMANTPKSSSSESRPNFPQPGKIRVTVSPNPSFDFLFGGEPGASGPNHAGESGFSQEGQHHYLPTFPGFPYRSDREILEETDIPLKSLTHAKNLTRYCVFQGISPLNPGECDKYLVCLPARFNRFNAFIAQCPNDKKFSTIYKRCVQPYLVPECSKHSIGRSRIDDNQPDSQVEVFIPHQFQKKKHENPLYRPIKAISTATKLNEIPDPVAITEPLFTYSSAYKLGQNNSELEDSQLVSLQEIKVVPPSSNQQNGSAFTIDPESFNATRPDRSRPDNNSTQIASEGSLHPEDNDDVILFDSDPSFNHSTNQSQTNDSLDSYFDNLIATNYLNGSVSNSSSYKEIVELYTSEESYSQNVNNTEGFNVTSRNGDPKTEDVYQDEKANTTLTSSSHFETDLIILDTIPPHTISSNSSNTTNSEYQGLYNEEQTEESLSQFKILHPNHTNVSMENVNDSTDIASTLHQNSTIVPNITSKTLQDEDQPEYHNTTSTASYSSFGNVSSYQSESIGSQEYYYSTPTSVNVTTEAPITNSTSPEPIPSDQAQGSTQSRAHHSHTTNVNNPAPVPEEESHEYTAYDEAHDRDHSFDRVGDVIMETPYVFPPNAKPNSNPVRRSVGDTYSHYWRKQ